MRSAFFFVRLNKGKKGGLEWWKDGREFPVETMEMFAFSVFLLDLTKGRKGVEWWKDGREFPVEMIGTLRSAFFWLDLT